MAEKPEDLLHPEGLFNPTLRFAFTNITDEEFTSYWGGQPIKIKAGQTVELTHHLAVKLTKELVDKIILGAAKLDKDAQKDPYYRSPMAGNLGVPAYRKQYEEKICRLLGTDEESPEIQLMRVQMKEELLAAQNKEQIQQPVHIPTDISEFADINKKEVKKEEQKPMRMKPVK